MQKKPKPPSSGKPSPKVSKFLSLAEILNYAAQTGEYRDPDHPRHANPDFQKSVAQMIDDIFSEEIDAIRTVASYERELLKRDVEIMQLKIERDLDRAFAARMQKMEQKLDKVYRNLTGEEANEVAKIEKQKALAEFRQESEAIKSSRAQEFFEQTQKRFGGLKPDDLMGPR